MTGFHRSRRTGARRALEDLEFLTKVREASLDGLLRLRENHEHQSAPQWKRVVIERALERYRRNA